MKTRKNGDPQPQGQDFLSKVEVGIILEEPERIKYFENLIKNTTKRDEVRELQIILKRIKIIVKHVDGFVPQLNTKFQNFILQSFYHRLTEKYFIEYLRDQKRRSDILSIDIKKDMDSLPIDNYGPFNGFKQLYLAYDFNLRLSQWLIEIIDRFTREKSFWVQLQDKKIRLTNEMVAGFCKLVNDSTLPFKNEGNAKLFCPMICDMYKLPYKERVRMAYYQPVTVSLATKIEKAILPNIPAPDREEIQKVIDSLSGQK
ncbi:MAG: hypothetical protein ABJC12_01735 [Saprospiraceae bacterium]